MMRWIITVGMIVLAGIGVQASAQAVSDGPGQVEEILGLTLDPEGVTFQVRTGGCTRPEHFRIERFRRAPTQLLLIRTVEDRCEALVPYGTTFKVSYTELRLADRETFVVINPIARVQVINLSF